MNQLSMDIKALEPSQAKEILDVAVRILPAWLNGELQSHRKLPLLPKVELSSVPDYKKLGKWLVYVRGFWVDSIPAESSLLFTAYRAKKEVEHGEDANWKSPTGPLITWYPDAVRAITSASNQGRSNVTTLLQTRLQHNQIMLDDAGLLAFLNWVKSNRVKLITLAGGTSKEIISQKPQVLSSVKRTIKSVQQTQPLLAYITSPISVNIIGSYNAAGG